MVSNTKRRAKCLAILGTASDVGKSIVVTALCRLASDRGLSVTPFKAQNMSNNSFVTPEGGEIGRAQVAQAEAARLTPHVDMNPVLLKPNSDLGAQVVLHGRPLKESSAKDYGRMTDALRKKAASSLERLRKAHDLVIMEGAGSCAEVNLKHRDIVNFAMAAIADAPVLLVADIDRGGVFAQIVGTLEIITSEERARVKGVLINRFRGDRSLFEDGARYLEKRTGLPLLGVIPYMREIGIDSEDAVVLDENKHRSDPGPVADRVSIAVIKLPHISNFTDFSPLDRCRAVKLDYLQTPTTLLGYDLVLLPGTKNVRGNMRWLREVGFESRLREYLDSGGRIGGICGGYQMLGNSIADPLGIEGPKGSDAGLALLKATTTLHRDKVLTRTEGVWCRNGDKVSGYEIHQGRTETAVGAAAAIRVRARNGQEVDAHEGVYSEDGRVFGIYLHGLFDEPVFRRSFLKELRPDLVDAIEDSSGETAFQHREGKYDRLADWFNAHVDVDAIFDIAGCGRGRS